jgi:peptidoglycan/xylan/chitin deacetylase (PgdA/CDA1 family)
LDIPGYSLAPPTILTYHKIGCHLELGITTVRRHAFSRHMDFLLNLGAGFACATDAAAACPAGGAVAVTFDDGYESVYTEAFPEMLDRGITGTVFPVVGSVGDVNTWDVNLSPRQVRHLSWAQIRELADAGFEIGSHTLSHRDLTTLEPRALKRELQVSKKTIENEIGVEVAAISYPFGRYSRRVIEEAAKAGYRSGFTSVPRPLGETMATGRWAMYLFDDKRSLERKLGLRAGRGLERIKNTLIAKISLGTTLVKR